MITQMSLVQTQERVSTPFRGFFYTSARSIIMDQNEIMSSVFEEISKNLDQDIQRQIAESNKKLFAEKLI